MINVGLIGYGNYGKKYFNYIINDRKFKIIKILKKRNIKSKLFTNNKEKFFAIKKVDLYIIASPAKTHFEYLDVIMKKNKHVIVEKPLVRSNKEFLKFKDNLKKFKKIILKNIKETNDLPFYEWLPHPLAIINNFFKNLKFKIIVKNKQVGKGKFIIQNLKIVYAGKRFNIKIFFSNDYKKKKRNLKINGSRGFLIFNGYNNCKGYFLKKNRKINLTVENDNPIQNLLEDFKIKLNQKYLQDDRKIICQTTNQLLDISNQIK